MENHKNEFTFSNKSIIAYVWRGVMVGIIAGVIVSLFRLLIEVTADWVIEWYRYAHINSLLLLPILSVSLLAVLFVGFLVKSDSDIKGSGIPHVEGELKGLMSPDWWSVLWKKFLGGIMAISMGFMLGREGPSIQLGAMSAKGLAKFLKSSRLEKRVLIASGAAAGLSAAFNAPIA
ncbi:TPA: chloride channel protein, partial [Streptococcus pyogenes]|nr:chloride channel protein [Streptococcus pyogenes]